MYSIKKLKRRKKEVLDMMSEIKKNEPEHEHKQMILESLEFEYLNLEDEISKVRMQNETSVAILIIIGLVVTLMVCVKI